MKFLNWLLLVASSYQLTLAAKDTPPSPVLRKVSSPESAGAPEAVEDTAEADASGDGQDEAGNDASLDEEEDDEGAKGEEEDDEDDEDEEDEDDEDDDEEDEELRKRKVIARTFEFCLRKGDLTPIELINCTGDLLIGNELNPNPSLAKCLGDYVTCTAVKCSAVVIKYQDPEGDYTGAFSCIGICVPQLVRCITRNMPLPDKG
ncbi:hypothetical protein BgAZ_203830 [Babesia gibsoni]|uniref:Uncharacterized protein n=1 Tax=Babesia gibsoni TaxID=33632 RepID=A0AAD8PE81_BABGI|nr:hypothetical protein BgAZ_203830 [Babesia gibsoni]